MSPPNGIPVKAAPHSQLALAFTVIHIHFSAVLAATCQYHPSGNTHRTFISYPQSECKYRPSGNPPCHRCRPTCYKYDNAELGFGPHDQKLTFLFSSISAPPTSLTPTASRAVNKLSKDGLSANSTDRDHVSGHLSTPSAIASESFVGQLSHTA